MDVDKKKNKLPTIIYLTRQLSNKERSKCIINVLIQDNKVPLPKIK